MCKFGFDCSVELSWNNELFGANQPQGNQIIEIKSEGGWGRISLAVHYTYLKDFKSASYSYYSKAQLPAEFLLCDFSD